jgi:hypothetical protein
MVVRTLGSGRNVSGLYIGPRNARRHFPRDRQHIELHLGHLHIFCDLMPDFWMGRPEIADARLGSWLFSRVFHGKAGRAPAPVAMIPAGKSSYRLIPFSMPAASSNGLTKIGPTPAVLHAQKAKGRREEPINHAPNFITAPTRP